MSKKKSKEIYVICKQYNSQGKCDVLHAFIDLLDACNEVERLNANYLAIMEDTRGEGLEGSLEYFNDNNICPLTPEDLLIMKLLSGAPEGSYNNPFIMKAIDIYPIDTINSEIYQRKEIFNENE